MAAITGGTVIDATDHALQRIYTSAGAPTTQFDGIAEKGALCIDSTNGVLYINTGTKGTNTWTVVGSQV